nr:unnamed protein product [Callosobruchus chinensis]
MIFDHQLTWKNHIKHLLQSCQKGINLLRCLTNRQWGAEGPTLLTVYRHLIRSMIDYGYIAYASAKQSLLKQLDTMHNSALRIILGAFRTTPIHSLYQESGEAPLYMRRQILSLSYATKLSTKPDIPTHKYLYRRSSYITKSIVGMPFNQRIKVFLQCLHISPNLLTHLQSSSTIPPWIIPTPEVITKLKTFDKHSVPATLIHQNFLRILDLYPEYTTIYTDASKSGPKVGAAIATSSHKQTIKLHDQTTSVSGELFAILEALKFAETNNINKFIIATDSLISLKMIKRMYTRNPIVNQIHEIAYHLNSGNTEIHMGFFSRGHNWKRNSRPGSQTSSQHERLPNLQPAGIRQENSSSQSDY